MAKKPTSSDQLLIAFSDDNSLDDEFISIKKLAKLTNKTQKYIKDWFGKNEKDICQAGDVREFLEVHLLPDPKIEKNTEVVLDPPKIFESDTGKQVKKTNLPLFKKGTANDANQVVDPVKYMDMISFKVPNRCTYVNPRNSVQCRNRSGVKLRKVISNGREYFVNWCFECYENYCREMGQL